MVTVIKSSGEPESFSEEKIRKSIHRAGIPDELQNQVVTHIQEKLYDNIPTSEIYRHITEFLFQKNPYVKAKYSLKQAIIELGPTGYPFEDFISHVLQSRGYITKVRQILQGNCITHEIDVVAEKENEKIIVEAKFHNIPGIRTNVHVALYTKARFEDVKTQNNITRAWIITNTNVSSDAIKYALCSNMTVISWNYPEGESLRELVQASGLIPLTALTTLSQNTKQQLLLKGIVTSKYVKDHPFVLDNLGLSSDEKTKTLEEAHFLSNHQE